MHERTMLQFGGGKDSLACLYLLRERWNDLTVCWLNTGAAFPETLAQMEEVKALAPHFLEVRADVLGDIEQHGWPVDVLPIAHTEWGARFTSGEGIKLRSWIDCCGANFWAPLQAEMKRRGVSRIIRGQRNSEHYKSPIRDGDVVEGVTYELPLQNWSEAEVFAFLKREGVAIPAHYAITKSSLDCWNCTAYLDAKGAQLRYLESVHPDRHAVVMKKLREIMVATNAALAPVREAVV